jgi:UPF0755 protein
MITKGSDIIIFFEKLISSKFKLTIVVLFLLFNIIFYHFFLSAPKNSKSTIIHVSQNQSLEHISKQLKEKNIVRNAFVFKLFASVFKSDRKIPKGDYLLKADWPAWRVAWMIVSGIHNVDILKITIKEGSTNKEIADLLSSKLSSFDKDLFLKMVEDKQGYLFPDTYFFYPFTTNEEIINELSNNFSRRIKTLNKDIKSNPKSLEDVIIMASIIQEEAHGESDSQLISGILWNRINIDMPIQVDVDRSTYKKVGLPERPISNPGLIAINASANPLESPYLYYLHDKSGKIYPATTYNEHLRNINKYLR